MPIPLSAALAAAGSPAGPVSGKLLFVGLNYLDHQAETNLELPSEPAFFAKLPSAVIGDGDPIVIPAGRESRVDYEGELAVIVARSARDVSAADALDHVLGYTIVNDVSDRGVQLDRGQLILGKGIDSFCPLGPVVALPEEIDDPAGLELTTRVNGEIRQQASTATMIFSVAEVLAFASRFATLEPGDIVSTGTPAGCGAFADPPTFLQPGDEVSVAIEGIGELRNPVVAAA